MPSPAIDQDLGDELADGIVRGADRDLGFQRHRRIAGTGVTARGEHDKSDERQLQGRRGTHDERAYGAVLRHCMQGSSIQTRSSVCGPGSGEGVFGAHPGWPQTLRWRPAGRKHSDGIVDQRGRGLRPAMPPSTASEVPVVAPAWGPARYSTAEATSSGVTRRPDGWRASSAARSTAGSGALSSSRATHGVSAVPGFTQFTRMPSRKWSAAIASVRDRTAPLLAL